MAWLRLDDGFTDHRKIVALKTDQRRWTWLRILIYTARYRSPIVPADIDHVVSGATAKFLGDCVEIGLLDENEAGELEVHDWAAYQPKDPTKAERQARWRAKKGESVDGGVDEPVDEPVDGDVDASRVGARAQPVPSPPVSENPAAAEGTQDAPEPAAADEMETEVLERLDDIGLSGKAVILAIENPKRAKAWLDQAERKAKTNPAGYVLHGLTSGEWPSQKALTKPGSSEPSTLQISNCPHCGPIPGGPRTLAEHLHVSHGEPLPDDQADAA